MAAEGALLSLAAAASFWVQSVVTEERLVPALHLVADHHHIPDDVAGATLMAAGASSPELLCTLVSLFVTRSSLGLGTIVGSEVFNQLVICAGSVYASRARRLVLDRRMVVRETAFYGVSLGLLSVALGERRAYEGKNGEEGEERVCVSFGKACLLVGGYVLYVVVCANTEAVEACLRRIGGRADGNCEGEESNAADDPGADRRIEQCTSHGSIHYKSFDDDNLHKLPFIHNVTTEPVENRETAAAENDEIAIANSSLSREGGDSIAVDDANGDAHRKQRRRGLLSTAARRLLCRAASHPVETHDVHELAAIDGGREMGCFLWQRSYFYTKAYFGSHAFHLRWFSITPQRVSSVPDRNEPDKHVLVYPLFDEIHVDERRLIIYIVHPEERRRNFTLMAPSRAIFDAVVKALEEYMRATVELRQQGLTELDESQHRGEDATTATMRSAKKKRKRDADDDPHVDLIEVPRNASHAEFALWASVYPLRLIMHITLPDVRRLDRHGQPAKSAAHAYLATVACLAWLVAGSYVMVASLESLAALVGLPDEIMGVTVSAAGTSLPAYIASRIAAEKGFGNQTVANVFGSNTFNICVGLGVPWAIFVAVHGFEPYRDLASDGIVESLLVMAGALLLFVALMASTNCVLVKWHADLFIGLYVAYIVYSIGQVYW